MALTVGLLAFLAIDATLEGFELAGEGSQAFGGSALVLLGAVVAYLLLSGVSAWMTRRKAAAKAAGAGAGTLALLVAVGIGLHNLGEGVAIGAAYADGRARARRVPRRRLRDPQHDRGPGDRRAARPRARPRSDAWSCSGSIAGAPAVLGAWIGAAAFNASAAAFLFGFGAGAIVQVIVQLTPSLRDDDGRALHPIAVGGMLAGLAVMFLTGLLVAA